MDILVTRVHDKSRFIHYMQLKFHISKSTALALPDRINLGYHMKLNGLPEGDVKYLQRNYYERGGRFIVSMSPPICDLKILSMPHKVKTIPPYLDNEKQSKPMSTDISPSPYDDKAQEYDSSMELYNVQYTKVITEEAQLTKMQVIVLMNDPNVKSINIKK